MAIEQKRGCGYRKVGGLYMVGGGIGVPCDRLPYELTVCPCCSQGVKQSRGWTWIDVAKFFQGTHALGTEQDSVFGECKIPCDCSLGLCPLCSRPETMGKAGLLWVGEKFYKTPADFVKEGVEMGFSRRIKAVPQGFKVGETWVMLAHPAAVRNPTFNPESGADVRRIQCGHLLRLASNSSRKDCAGIHSRHRGNRGAGKARHHPRVRARR